MSSQSADRSTQFEEDGKRAADRVPRVDRSTPPERAARGRAERADAPRRAHADWQPPPNGRDPVALLEEQAKTRVPELVPIRYGRMLMSPFAFYRGTAALMAADLAHGVRTGLYAQLCGDAHLSNFGVFATPDRRLTFDLNDFDETLPGPFEWDVKRLAASFAVAGRDRGFATKVRARICTAVVRSYREAMRDFASMSTLDLWYARTDVDDLLQSFRTHTSSTDDKQIKRGLAKARTRTSLKAFAKLTHLVDGERRIVGDPPLIVPIDEIGLPGNAPNPHEALQSLIRGYRRTLSGDRRRLLDRFRYVDAARKVVGVGSVGTWDWIVLMLGRDSDDPLFVQAKEAEASVLEPYLGKSAFVNHGQRVVEGQRLVQAASDILLGWLRDKAVRGEGRDFYVRQLWDQKGSVEIEVMKPSAMEDYARLCGSTLAKGHARSGDAIAIAGYLGRGNVFDNALAAFAEAYADQNERDYGALQQAVESGRITAQTGI
jgi:uncharacterized protein (DUF2252 family)